MKIMKCSQIGGPSDCEVEFKAETFEEIAEQSKQHGMEMFQIGDESHLKAMNEIKDKMQDPSAMEEWMIEKKKEFNSLSEDN